jgi:NAD(P)-dependent dehydrogenase (short-subunit alcohol dehydrogenase family)
MNIDLKGKVALVTGAAMGIGRGCAECLAQAGAHVIVADRSEADGLRAVSEIIGRGGSAAFQQSDISDLADIEKLSAAVNARHGKLDVLINNAGFNLFKGIQQTSPEDFDAILDLDLRGLFFLTRAVVPLLKNAGAASVIHIASVHATATVANIAAYAAAKGGVVAVTRAMCQELGPFGIRVNSISPGFVKTPLLDRWLASESDPAAALERVNGFHPIGRIGTPADIGALVVFLSSAQAGFITGANLTIDGGLTSRLMH